MKREFVRLDDLGVEDVAQLPDWVFGDRRPVVVSGISGASTWDYGATEGGLPDRVVVWGFGVLTGYAGGTQSWVRVGFVTGVPASEAEIDGCVPLLRGFGQPGVEPWRIYVDRNLAPWWVPCRLVVETGGLRVGAVFRNIGAVEVVWSFRFVYSEVPSAIPVGVARHLGLME